jgi:dephospho-CoA kinase
MKWIGLTGGIATGKSSVTKVLRTLGYEVIDADEVAHAVTAPGEPVLAEIFAVFGNDVRAPDGSLDRRALGQKVFGHPDQIKKLENIVHPLIIGRVMKERERLEKTGARVAFYDVPLLFEKGMELLFDAVILVFADEQQQLQRLLARKGLTLSEAAARLKSQWPIGVKKNKASHVIDNSFDVSGLQKEVLRVLKELGV